MKTLKTNINIAILVILFTTINLFSAKTFANCVAGFTWTQTAQNVITFTNTSTGTTINTHYWWSFGDGGYSDSINNVYTYNIPGTYYVCLQIYDSLAGCNSTFCDTIIVTGVIICNLTVSTYIDSIPDCSTCATGGIEAWTTGGTAPFSYLWSNGATTQYVYNLLPGTYTCCITDANNCSACSSSTIDTCAIQAGFTWSQTSNNTISFISTSASMDSINMYSWSFGDNNWSYYNTVQSPSHFYNAPGTYYVCLEIESSIHCYSTWCDSVTVTGTNCNNFTDTITLTNPTCFSCDNGIASTNLSGGTSPYHYEWYYDTWNYYPNGDTMAIASNLARGYYYCSVTDANGCTAITYFIMGPTIDSCVSYFTIHADSITQHLYWAVNYAYGMTYITNYNWSWGDSSPDDSTAYPSHLYANAGVYTICLSITDSSGCTSTYCSNDSIQRTSNTMIQVNVISPLTLGINKVESLSNWAVYPNPVSNSMTINYVLSHSTNVLINVYDMIGNKVSEVANSMQSAGQHSTLWDASTTPQGIYLLQVIVDSKILNQKITVMR